MSNVSINWDITTPSATSLIGDGYNVFLSMKTSIQSALDAEHVFPASGGSAGAHRLGSARAFVGPSSQVSSSDTDGRLMIDSTNTRLWAVGSSSSGTFFLGGLYALEGLSAATVNGSSNIVQSLFHWGFEVGQSSITTGSATRTIVYQTAFGLTPVPMTWVQPVSSNTGMQVLNQIQTQFQVALFGGVAPPNAPVTFNYFTIGVKL